ncbi:sugar transferase [Aminobacterium sp. MB27-C1]|uniref:sugar transferase n=1 Tax=Aminobacterium sp. MB27-C1 TaxID=3070661 RepID=UPI001BCA9207|nr:sugar transferase [Aminobacterium sp. MB27-C1]WMI71646.1 sugar transferase [Aminobacterium sp. MB27-C1]
MKTHRHRIYQRFFKRPLDFTLASLSILLLSPVFLIIAVLVKIKLGSPVIFKQQRPGLNEKIFTMYKFRTMTNERDANGELLADSERLKKFGKFLRSTSLDELPELFNVLKGDMSIVGPRPLLIEYTPLYDEQQRKRLNVLPGITGWAQVNGRNALTWEEKFKLDTWYVENWNFILDLKIIVKTILVVLKREGISAQGEATMSRFTGNIPALEKQRKDHYE